MLLHPSLPTPIGRMLQHPGFISYNWYDASTLSKFQLAITRPCHPEVFSNYNMKETSLLCLAPPIALNMKEWIVGSHTMDNDPLIRIFNEASLLFSYNLTSRTQTQWSKPNCWWVLLMYNQLTKFTFVYIVFVNLNHTSSVLSRECHCYALDYQVIWSILPFNSLPWNCKIW